MIYSQKSLTGNRRPMTSPPSTGSPLGDASPLLLSAFFAFVGSFPFIPATLPGVPIALLVLIAIQAGAFAIAGEFEAPRWRAMWLVLLLVTGLLVPAVALQTSVSRTPFVSLSRGSAGIALWTTAGVAILLVCLFVVVVAHSLDDAFFSLVLWTPVVMVLPAMLAAPGMQIEDTRALRAVSLAYFIAAVAVFVCGWSPESWRIPVVVAMFVMESGLLLLLGRGLTFPPTQGKIVPVLAALLVGCGAIGLIALPTLVRMLNSKPPPTTTPVSIRDNREN